jgi:hypothetical protein
MTPIMRGCVLLETDYHANVHEKRTTPGILLRENIFSQVYIVTPQLMKERHWTSLRPML